MVETARLYLVTPPLERLGDFPDQLRQAVEPGDVACVLLRLRARDDQEAKKIVRAAADIVQPRGAALLLEADAGADSATLAMRANADGVHYGRGLSQEFVEGAAKLKPRRIVGLGGITSRDDAMVAGEADVDYLMFGARDARGITPDHERTLELVTWWADIFNVPCVAYAHDLAEIVEYSKAGAEFVALGAAVFEDPRGVAAAMADARRLIALSQSDHV
ncbi:MAG: thiamine phosphate synthase [Hyphomicrobiales bacterium]|nr:thiamine phosphate synthase [Hyphomicrobiales bacterium]